MLLPFSFPALAQPPMATLSGQVVEADTHRPVGGASVLLVPGNISLTSSTDSAGRFHMAAIPVGHYALRVAALGYDTLEVPELWLRAGKQGVQLLELSAATGMLGPVTVSAMAREQVNALGIRTFTVEQSLRWPATFQDPGRMATALPGVAGVNDQANHLSIRGNSPNANAWLLEGAEIVNPNHTGNAGTATDLPTLSGGGVNALSAQMLATSRLLTGVFPMPYDNALGGILDMRLRDGNRQQQEWTLQAGLLGLDLSTEGPIRKGGRSSYLVNYRYSTVGLLGAMGIDLGDEAITYQDLSFHLAFPIGKRGEWHLFGLAGKSSNRFEAVHDTAAWKVDKDSRNIDYRSSMGAMGARMRQPLGEHTSLSAVVAVSESMQQRTEDRLRDDFTIGYHAQAELNERKISGTVQLDGTAGGRIHYTAGVNALGRTLDGGHAAASGWLLRPWASGRWALTDRLQADAGVGLPYFTFNGQMAAEPRAGLQWRMRKGRTIAASAGIRSQLPQWQSFPFSFTNAPVNNTIGFTRSQDLVIGYDHPVGDRLRLHLEAYHQTLSNLPVYPVIPGMEEVVAVESNLANIWDEPVLLPMAATGKGTNMGMEASVDHRLAGNIFYQANGSLYNSRYTLGGTQEYDSRWDGRYILNVIGGKEFRKQKEDRVRTWGISARLNLMGGMRERPVSERLSAAIGSTVYGSPYWTDPLADFRRLDLRIYLRKDRKGRTGLWALDLQNVTNTRNEAFRYFDARQGKVVTQLQLGLIPNISYRIEF